jgi:methyltransferase
MMTALAVLIVVFSPMAVEATLAASNERTQRARGGIEPPGDVYKMMRVAYPAAFLAMIAEGFVRGAPSAPVLTAGIVLFAAAKALKWWAILTLGPFWTFRVIVVPGTGLVASGPYRYLRHPNYAAVAGELVASALMTGAAITGPVAIVGFGFLMLKRIAVEERALRHTLGVILPPN